MPAPLFDLIWQKHIVRRETAQRPAILYIDLHLTHEVTSPQAYSELEARGLRVRRPDRTVATIDHSTPTLPIDAEGRRTYVNSQAQTQVERLIANSNEHGVPLLSWESAARGIVHVIGPELGLTQPGMTIVCGDSHTATHGAFGAVAFGIGGSQVTQVLATQTLLMRKPKTMGVAINGRLQNGVTAKDLVLALIAELGVDGGVGYALEYYGDTVRNLNMESRMTICNMSIEAGARFGLMAPDETTINYLRNRPHLSDEKQFSTLAKTWKNLASNANHDFDHHVTFSASAVEPMITYGTDPGMAGAIEAPIPEPRNAQERDALEYMQLSPGKPLSGKAVDTVFIGSCTNSRLSDLKLAARILSGRKTANGVRVLVVPGSEQVKRQAESRGLHEVFLRAGAEWREPGCSMCIAMNGDQGRPGELVISTSNRNFKGRQGPGVRTLLASPASAAAAAITGKVSDPRSFLERAP